MVLPASSEASGGITYDRTEQEKIALCHGKGVGIGRHPYCDVERVYHAGIGVTFL